MGRCSRVNSVPLRWSCELGDALERRESQRRRIASDRTLTLTLVLGHTPIERSDHFLNTFPIARDRVFDRNYVNNLTCPVNFGPAEA